MNIMERPGDITETVIPSVSIGCMRMMFRTEYLTVMQIMQQTCTDWDAWSNSNVVDEIDSGV